MSTLLFRCSNSPKDLKRIAQTPDVLPSDRGSYRTDRTEGVKTRVEVYEVINPYPWGPQELLITISFDVLHRQHQIQTNEHR